MRIKEVTQKTGFCRNTLLNRAEAGTFTLPIRIQARLAWPDYEVEMLIRANLSLDPERTIKTLVQKLYKVRLQLSNDSTMSELLPMAGQA